jgi:RNA polymerase sigma factor (sigma-70 family)
MALKCQSDYIKCPAYKHQGIFRPDNKTVKSLLPDLKSCAACMSSAPPKRPDLREDMLQIASLTLVEKGPKFDPSHESGASFGTFIRPRICGALMDAKGKEICHSNRELLNWNSHNGIDDGTHQYAARFGTALNLYADFEDELVRDISFASALPTLLKVLTPRERAVFACLRENQRNREIAEILQLSESRVSQLVSQVTVKLTNAAQKLGLAD